VYAYELLIQDKISNLGNFAIIGRLLENALYIAGLLEATVQVVKFTSVAPVPSLLATYLALTFPMPQLLQMNKHEPELLAGDAARWTEQAIMVLECNSADEARLARVRGLVDAFCKCVCYRPAPAGMRNAH
jgi:hypothetical protein